MTTRTRKPPILPMKRNQDYSLEEFALYIANFGEFIHHVKSYCNTHKYDAIEGIVTRYRSKRVAFFIVFAKNKGRKTEHYVTIHGVINGVNKNADDYYVTNVHFDTNISITPIIGE